MISACGGSSAALAAARARHGAAAVREPPAHAERRIHLRHRGAGGRCGGQLLRGEPSAAGTIGKVAAGAARSELFAELPPGAPACRSASAPTGACILADYKDHNVFVFEPGAKRRGSISTRTNSISRTTWRSRATARSTPAIPLAPPRRPGLAHRAGRRRHRPRRTDGRDAQARHHQWHRSQPGREDALRRRIRDARDLGLPDRRRKLATPRLVKKFSDFSLDGLRTDIDGRIYVARILKGTVEVLAPDGKTFREIPLRARSRPTWRSAGRTARPSTSPSARAASSRHSASTGRDGSFVCSGRGRCHVSMTASSSHAQAGHFRHRRHRRHRCRKRSAAG